MVEIEKIEKPPITPRGKIFFITEAFPPVSVGSSVVNRNLLSYFNAKSYVVITTHTRFRKQLDKPTDVDIRYVSTSFEHFSSKIHRYLLPFQLWFAKRQILRFAKRERPVAIIATYPSYYYLQLGYSVARILGIPFMPYLHDTLVEALHRTALEKKACLLQSKIWKNASVIFVMSQGIKDLYKRKYNIDSVPIIHTYLERVACQDIFKKSYRGVRKAFWAGDVYGINDKALSRLVPVLNSLGYNIEFTTPRRTEDLEAMGIPMETNQVNFYPSRFEYLKAIGEADILLLALNYADECHIHSDELGTIFPTKTPEYLSSGKLILVYAPEDYFLTNFFKTNQCGLVVHGRNPDELRFELKQLFNENNEETVRNNALRVANMFQQRLVAESFSIAVSNVLDKN